MASDSEQKREELALHHTKIVECRLGWNSFGPLPLSRYSLPLVHFSAERAILNLKEKNWMSIRLNFACVARRYFLRWIAAILLWWWERGEEGGESCPLLPSAALPALILPAHTLSGSLCCRFRPSALCFSMLVMWSSLSPSLSF